MSDNNLLFTERIINWYGVNKRDVPWRNTKDPYYIWLSEVILQQTRVAQGLPYYKTFVEAFPSIQDLAHASEEQVLKLWQGLGYYSRARNMHHTARYIVTELNGNFPNKYSELIKLKGVGDYTASAIASFCFNEIQPVVDGNVYRILARYFGVSTPINSNKAQKEFKEIAFELIDAKNPGLFNQAIMEFGSLQCRPRNPNCDTCDLSTSCVALHTNQVSVLPKKNKKTKFRKRFFNYLLIETEQNKIVVNKRKGKGIWENLYEFPLVETSNQIDYNNLITNSYFINITKNKSFNIRLLTPKTIIHKLSHQHLHINIWKVDLKSITKKTISWDEALELPFPIVLHRFIENFISKVKA